MRIQDHAIASVEDAEFVVTPWPHLALREFLPWDYYAELLAHWPVEADWRELVYPDQRKPDGTYRRRQLMLTETVTLAAGPERMVSTGRLSQISSRKRLPSPLTTIKGA